MTSQAKNLYDSSLEAPEKNWDVSDVDWVSFGKKLPSNQSHSQVLFAFASEKTFDTTFLELVKKHSLKLKLLLLYYKMNDFDNYLHKLIENVSKDTIRKTIAFDDFKVLKRITNAWKSESQEILISKAISSENQLSVTDCASNRFEIAFDLLPELSSVVNKRNFEIDEAGSFLYWPDADFHLNLEDIRCRIDKKFEAAIIRKQLPKNKLYGKSIKIFREQSNLKQTDFGDISERTIRRIENGLFVPTLDTLKKLSLAHKLELNEYINSVSKVYQSMKTKSQKTKPRRAAV